MSRYISRSTFLKLSVATVFAGCGGKALFDAVFAGNRIACRMLGPSMDVGHRVRDGRFKSSAGPTGKTSVAIIGGGMSGLSAAWWLKRNGFTDFRLFELEDEVGGNARSGKNPISAYPWGAHYVPIANPESKYVLALFEELGIIQGRDTSGKAIYNDLYLCHEPQERLLKDGSFQEGMIPKRGLQPQHKKDIERFLTIVHGLRDAVGSDGKPAFAIPLDQSSRDEQFTALDRISFSQWLKDNNLQTKPLLWYLTYCCRDDYGSTPENVSAWAGIHYFAGRRGTAANSEMNSVVTWPEGNGFLVRQLKDMLRDHITTGAAAARVEQKNGTVSTTFMRTATGESFGIDSRYAIFAAPRFIAKHVVEGGEDRCPSELLYAPWMVANVSVKYVPKSEGIPLSWDNVSYLSDSLGYVVATHQDITTRESSTVLTYYYPLSHRDPATARKELLSTSKDEWSERIVADLNKMHPGIQDAIESIDLWPWGHGMVRPAVGFIWGESRSRMTEPCGNLYFAHSDMSGMSNFEEAQYHGVQAAQAILAKVKST